MQFTGIFLQKFREGCAKERARVKPHFEEDDPVGLTKTSDMKQESVVARDSAMLGVCLQGYHEVNLWSYMAAASALLFTRGIVACIDPAKDKLGVRKSFAKSAFYFANTRRLQTIEWYRNSSTCTAPWLPSCLDLSWICLDSSCRQCLKVPCAISQLCVLHEASRSHFSRYLICKEVKLLVKFWVNQKWTKMQWDCCNGCRALGGAVCLCANLAVKWILQAANDNSDSSSAKPCKGRQHTEIGISNDGVAVLHYTQKKDPSRRNHTGIDPRSNQW